MVGLKKSLFQRSSRQWKIEGFITFLISSETLHKFLNYPSDVYSVIDYFCFHSIDEAQSSSGCNILIFLLSIL